MQFQLDTRITPEAARAAAVGSELSLTPIGPVRDVSAVDYYANEPADWTTTAFGNLAAGTPFRTGARTQPVAYANRTEGAAGAGAAVAGVRYVRVAYNVRGDDANLAYTLTVRTSRPAGRHAPSYDETTGLAVPAPDSRLVDALSAPAEETDPTAVPEPSAGAEASEPADRTAPEATGDSGGGPSATVLATGIAALAALVTLVGIAALRRRRTAR